MDWTAEGVGWTSGGRGELDRAAITSLNNVMNSAHEIGHHFDREDEYGDASLGIPIQSTLIWQNGKSVAPPLCSGDTCLNYYNFMGNAGVGAGGSDYWVDARTWNAILDTITRQGMIFSPMEVASLEDLPPLQEVSYPPLSPHSRPALWLSVGQAEGREWGEERGVDGPALLVMGTLDAQGNAAILTVDRLHHYVVPSSDTGEYRLEALDHLGNLVGWTDFNTYPLDIDEQVPFLVTIPLEGPGNVFNLVSEIRLSRNGSAMASTHRSPTAPTVSFDTAPDLTTDPITLSWSAQDADGNPLRSSVYYTIDGGQSWYVLALDLTDTQLEMDPATLPGGEAQFRVVVNDGMDESIALTSPITVPDRPPSAFIDLPWGDTFTQGQDVVASGYGFDSEDGDLPPESLAWSDENGQFLGQGGFLKTRLVAGTHTLSLTALDSTGQKVAASVEITVKEQEPEQKQEQGEKKKLGGLWPPTIWLCPLSGLIALVAFVSIGFGAAFVLRPGENALAALQEEGQTWRARYQSGQLPPNLMAQFQARLQARDRRGNLWSFDPFREQWLCWDGRVWQAQSAPGDLQRGKRLGCGILLIVAGLAILVLAIALVVVFLLTV